MIYLRRDGNVLVSRRYARSAREFPEWLLATFPEEVLANFRI